MQFECDRFELNGMFYKTWLVLGGRKGIQPSHTHTPKNEIWKIWKHFSPALFEQSAVCSSPLCVQCLEETKGHRVPVPTRSSLGLRKTASEGTILICPRGNEQMRRKKEADTQFVLLPRA